MKSNVSLSLLGDLCLAVSGFCRAHRHLRQGGVERREFGPGDGNPDRSRLTDHLGDRAGSGNARGIPGLSKNNWIFLVLSAVATGLSWLFYYRALQLGRVSQVSVIDKGSILFTILLSFLFLKEPLTPRVIAAALLITAGMLVLIWK